MKEIVGAKETVKIELIRNGKIIIERCTEEEKKDAG